jgi:PAS domain S-box-containing protein
MLDEVREQQTKNPFDSTLQQFLAAIVESSDDAIIGKDLHGIICSWNRGAERIFGYSAAESLGRHISMLAPPDRVSETSTILAKISHGEHVEHYQTKRVTKDGRILSISLTVSPIRNRSGIIVGASKIARDVTEQVLAEEALHQANDRLRQANADLEEFGHSASHDLREPLRVVSVYAELLRRHLKEGLDPAGERYIEYIAEAAQRMEKLLTGLRTYMQASVDARTPPAAVDANECLRHASMSLQSAIDDTGASIVHSDLPSVAIHGFHLEEVFQNLLSNALRYRSDQPPRIEIGAESMGDTCKFSVRDNGIGINPTYQEEIFGLFKRLHTHTQYPGSGLGLAICRRIIERTGGRIWVESEPGRGATFLFTVPSGRTESS